MHGVPPFPDMQHRFTSELKSKDCVEDDHVVFSIDVEEDDAEVEWFKDGVPIIPDGKRYGRRALPRLRTLSRFLFDDAPQVYYVLCFSPLFCTVQASLSVFSFWYSVSPFFPTLFICRHRRRKMLPSARVAFFASPAELL